MNTQTTNTQTTSTQATGTQATSGATRQASQDVSSANGSAQERRGQRQDLAMRPPVDVFETAEGITLWADMPGVSKDRLNLRVDGNTLLLEGNVEFPMAEQMEALYADVRSTSYRCSFALSNELDTARVEANLKDGVLFVRIPKRAELRPRRIEVSSA
jgi:HSP20 family molecular chaperone IbpA